MMPKKPKSGAGKPPPGRSPGPVGTPPSPVGSSGGCPVREFIAFARQLADRHAERWRANPRTFTRAEWQAEGPARDRDMAELERLHQAALNRAGRLFADADRPIQLFDNAVGSVSRFLYRLPGSFTCRLVDTSAPVHDIPEADYRPTPADEMLSVGDLDFYQGRLPPGWWDGPEFDPQFRASFEATGMRRLTELRPQEDAELAGRLSDINSALRECEHVANVLGPPAIDPATADAGIDKETLALAALFKFGPNESAIAREIGVPRTTLHGWPRFKAARDQLLANATKAKAARRGNRDRGADFSRE